MLIFLNLVTIFFFKCKITGDLFIVQYNIFQTVSKHNLTDSEIVHICSIPQKKRILIAALDGYLYISNNGY